MRFQNIAVSHVSWEFIKNELRKGQSEEAELIGWDIPVHVKQGVWTIAVNWLGLTIDAVKWQITTEWIVLDTAKKMGAGRKVFGCTFGYGVQSWPSKAPNLFTGERVRKSSRKLKLHDNVNIVMWKWMIGIQEKKSVVRIFLPVVEESWRVMELTSCMNCSLKLWVL